MAASGAKVLQLRSVEYARTHGVRMHCRSSFEDGPGTVVSRRGRDDGTPAHHRRHPLDRRGQDHARSACPTVRARRRRSSARSPTRTATSTRSSRTSHAGRAVTPRSLHGRDRGPARRRARARAGSGEPRDRRDRHRPQDRQGLDRRRRHALAPGRRRAGVRGRSREKDINIEMISTSPIKISCVIRPSRSTEAVRALHDAFELGESDVHEERPIGQEAR